MSSDGPLPRSSDAKLRVGLVIGQLTYGGAESQLFELARNLGPDVDRIVYCLSVSDQPYGDRLREAGVEVRVLPARGGLDVSRVWRLAAMLRRDRIELVHAYLFIASAYAYLATRLTPGVALVGSARNCKHEGSAVRRWIMRRAFRASGAVLCNSRQMADFAVEHYGAPADRVRVVYNGVDMTRFPEASPAPSAPRSSGRGLRVGTVGRIEEQKNLELFLGGAREILKTRPDAVFDIVGIGSLRPHFEQRARELEVERSVNFLGTTSDIPGFLASLDIFWLTSNWEGTPNVVLEAMAAGVPVVATRVGGTPEVVEDGTTGFLVDAGDRAALVDRTLRIAEDPGLAASMRRDSRAAASGRFSIPAMVDSTTHVYSEALGLVSGQDAARRASS